MDQSLVPSNHVPISVDGYVWMRFPIVMKMHIWGSEILVEASIQRMVLVLLAQMPLSHYGVVIAGLGKQLGYQDLSGGNATNDILPSVG